MKTERIKKVFSVSLKISPSKLCEDEKKHFKQFKVFVVANTASEAFEATKDLGKEFLDKYGLTGFEDIEICQSYMDWRIVI